MDRRFTSIRRVRSTRDRTSIEPAAVPALGKHLLHKLKPLPIQSYYAEALRTGRRDGGGGLKAQTVLHHHRVLRQALGQAVKWQLVAFNPASATEPPRPDRREMKVLDENNVVQVLKLVRESSIHIEILLAVTTGMRRGEILALRWTDVDFKKATVAVQQSLEQTRAGGLRFKRPKTERSRVIVLPALVVESLKRHRAEQATRRLQLGPAYKDADLICCLVDGTPRSPAGLTRAFRDLLADKKLPRVRFHDLRHTHATLLLSQGTHPKVVSERLGHSTIGITLDTYSHVLPSMQEEAARRLNDALRAAIGKSRRS